ncbi:MAG: glycerate kinase [Synergistales bacterium]|nr:glycerate kinase [Synergistales bacterium]MDY6401159.1 glycerate kinase [Synergistales bacterium]MDY6404752.1 glycerate kinase [Synergistales bacterium]MDY6409958.1 glycerate kinase [Synergistales bacterium]MDY6414510.1 glycerate kinase [Synergistales bacterium]
MHDMKQDMREIIDRAIKAVLPEAAVKEALKREDFLARKQKGRLIVASIGKAAWRMAKAASDILGSEISGAVVTKYEHSMGEIKGLEIFEAGHPVLDENTLKGTQELLKHVKNLNEDDTVLFLVSGGGSALFELPAEGVTLADMKDITSQLLSCGADIVEINTIRKHLSSVKGGRFAQLCAPAHVFMVVLSDVLGDRLDSIASGPAWPDSSTSEEALAIVKKYDLKVKPELMKVLSAETPKKLDNVTAVITGSVTALCEAACEIAKSKGYNPLVLTTTMTCEAREAGSFVASVAREVKNSGRPVKAPCALIAGGETVVHLTGHGRGGRNQEFALAAAENISGVDGIVIASLGSDGTDGPTDAAGGIVDGKTAAILKSKGINISDVLKENDAYHALKAADALLMTGPTGTNVNDVAIALIR